MTPMTKRPRRRVEFNQEEQLALIAAWYARHRDDRCREDGGIPDIWSEYMRTLLTLLGRPPEEAAR
jgi:hypothetical protein